MKRYFIILFLLPGFSLIANAQNGVVISPEFPTPGDSVIITYTPGKHLNQAPVLHFTYSNFFEMPQKMAMANKGDDWRAAFILPPYAVFATFVIDIGDEKVQPSAKRHYPVMVYNSDRERVKKSYLYEGYSLSAQEGKSPELHQHQAALYSEELKHYPDSYEAKLRLLSYKISIAPESEKANLYDEANEVIAANFYKDPGNMGLTNYTTMGYLIMGEKSRLDSLREVIKKNYPNTEAGYELRIDDIASIKDSAKMVKQLEAMLKKEDEKNRKFLVTAHNILFHYYAGKHNASKALHHLSFLHTGFTPYTPQTLKAQAEVLYKNALALDTALALAHRSLSYADTFPISLIRYFPETGYLPSFVSRAEREASIHQVNGQLNSLIALILLKQGKSSDAHKKMTSALNTSDDNETLKNAGTFFMAVKNYESAFDAYRKVAYSDPLDTLAYSLMRKTYKQWKGSEKGLEKYVVVIEGHWKAEMTKSLQKEIISKPFPDVLKGFVDLKGKPVPASLIQNKVLVLDFWATWCVPCMKAMPYMEEVYQQFRNDTDVVFMIVNSGSQNALSDAQNWWGNDKYSFPVYYNTDRSMGEKLGISLIPTTFIIDQSGQIRFKTVGFDGPVMTRKLSAQIETVKNMSNGSKEND